MSSSEMYSGDIGREQSGDIENLPVNGNDGILSHDTRNNTANQTNHSGPGDLDELSEIFNLTEDSTVVEMEPSISDLQGLELQNETALSSIRLTLQLATTSSAVDSDSSLEHSGDSSIAS